MATAAARTASATHTRPQNLRRRRRSRSILVMGRWMVMVKNLCSTATPPLLFLSLPAVSLAVRQLEEQLGTVDAATGNVMSYGYEGTVTIDGVDYYNYRVSWLVDGDHMSYLTNYLVSADGLVVQEYLPEAD